MMYQSGQTLSDFAVIVAQPMLCSRCAWCNFCIIYQAYDAPHMIWQVLTMVMTIINIAMLKHCIFNVLISIYLNTHRSINFLIFTGMTSPAPPNTRQVRLPLNLFIYLRHFERVAFKSGCSINKLLHCKPNTNTQCQKIPTSQNYSRYKLILSVFVCQFCTQGTLCFLALLLFNS